MTTYQSPSNSSRTVRRAPQGLQSTARENNDAEIASDAPAVRGDDSRVQALALAFTGQDILNKSIIMREHQTDSAITAEIRAASSGDNLQSSHSRKNQDRTRINRSAASSDSHNRWSRVRLRRIAGIGT